MKSTDETKAFADRLSDLLDEAKKKGMNHRQIAMDSGLGSHASLSKYASDTTEAGLNGLVKLARYFDVSLDYLVGISNVRSRNTTVKKIVDYTGLYEDAVGVLHDKQSEVEEKGRTGDKAALGLLSWLLIKADFWRALKYMFFALMADARNEDIEVERKSKLSFPEDGATVQLLGDEAGNYLSQQAEKLLSGLIQALREDEEVWEND